MPGIIKCFTHDCRFHDESEVDHCNKPLHQITVCSKAIVKKNGKSRNDYYQELMSNECICGKEKKPRKSFCFTCFKVLPKDIQVDLYMHIGFGYEEAHDAAVAYLGEWG